MTEYVLILSMILLVMLSISEVGSARTGVGASFTIAGAAIGGSEATSW